jgi:hypothetical protein
MPMRGVAAGGVPIGAGAGAGFGSRPPLTSTAVVGRVLRSASAMASATSAELAFSTGMTRKPPGELPTPFGTPLGSSCLSSRLISSICACVPLTMMLGRGSVWASSVAPSPLFGMRRLIWSTRSFGSLNEETGMISKMVLETVGGVPLISLAMSKWSATGA